MKRPAKTPREYLERLRAEVAKKSKYDKRNYARRKREARALELRAADKLKDK